MKMDRKLVSIMLLFFLTLSIFSIFGRGRFQANAQPPASLTGTIYDRGVDTDADTYFNYLEVGVEVNVTDAGYYQVEVSDLRDASFNKIGVYDSEYLFLDASAHVINLSLYGPRIYVSGLNPFYVSSIHLYDEYWQELDSLYDVSLSREYAYIEFDPPPASLTGTIHDQGVYTDMDGDFDYLEVGVEVNVIDEGYFQVSVSGLEDSDFNYISVYDSEYLFLDVDVQVVNLSLSGQKIYTSGLNPAYVSNIYLYNEEWMELDSLYNVPLSEEYAYTEFDFIATLTGTIYDRGVDTDEDGDFDYLEISVEVNVSDAGSYRIYASRLKEDSGYVYVSDYEDLYLDAGVHVVNLSLYGPTIYSSRVNPVSVYSLSLYENPHDYYSGAWLGNRYDVPLSHQYFYYEFDAPFADVEAKFTVYPDGRVVMGGALNYTHMAPPYEEGIEVFGDTSFTRTDGSTEMLANFAFTVQPKFADTFPYNCSSFNLLGTYSGDTADISIDGSVIFPPSLASQFPLNVSDFTVVADYLDDEITGTITVPLISGVPVATIDVPFHGNLTDLYLSDDLEIVYGTFFDYEVNETMVEELLLEINSTIPGTEPGSLYEATNGILECTRLDTTMTKKTGGATITFDAHIHGDFVQLFVFYMTGGLGDPGLYWFANALVSSVETGHFELAYAHEFGEASMHLAFTANFTELWSDLESTLPEEIPPEQRAPVEFLLNTTLCSVDSADVSWTYENGRSDLHVNATIGPDFNAELNFIKNVAVTYGMPQPPPLQWQIINETEIDLSNLSVTFNLTRTSILGTVEGFEVMPPIDPVGSDTTRFKLEQFFNLTADFPFPSSGEQLKLIVEGGNNVTHAVTLISTGSVPTPNETGPNNSYMIWYNQSISNIKDLTFKIEPQTYTARVLVTDQVGDPIQNATVKVYWPNGTLYKSLTSNDFGYTRSFTVDYAYMPYGEYNITANYQEVSATKSIIISYSGVYPINLAVKGSQKTGTITNPESVNATTPFIIDATEKASSKLVITEIDKPVEVAVRNVTTLPENVEPPPGTFKVLGNYVEIIVNETDITVNATIYIYYTLEQLSELGLDESSSQIYYWNATEGKWIPVESHVNTDEHYVWAVVNHLSIWAIMGQPSPFWTQIWFLALIACVIVVIVAIGVVYVMKKKKKTEQ